MRSRIIAVARLRELNDEAIQLGLSRTLGPDAFEGLDDDQAASLWRATRTAFTRGRRVAYVRCYILTIPHGGTVARHMVLDVGLETWRAIPFVPALAWRGD